jgi:hypothetical protein
MQQTIPLLRLEGQCDPVVTRVIQRMNDQGLQVLRSFDLKAARNAHTRCECPNHGTEQCNCQMIVLLVYGNDARPATMIAHGHNGFTELLLVHSPGQAPSPEMENAIHAAILTASPHR